VLTPPDLGLEQIVVDGSARQVAGAQQVRVHVLYEPSGQGSEDDRIIYFKDDTWKGSWFVVTRSVELAGSLTYDWQETAADGSTIRHPAITTDTPQLKL
jgi:hypothetical protein